jgi:leucyl-tRNA---protein transferase
MILSLFTYTSPPSVCGYLPEQIWSLRYDFVACADAADYEKRLLNGWRRFGRAFFHPACPSCSRCFSIRVPVSAFEPDRSQRRAWKANTDVRLEISAPSVTEEKLALYDRYHEHQSDNKGWPEHGPKDSADYNETFVDNPFPTEEWRYYIGDRLIGVGYVDVVPSGLSAIYFYYDPDEKHRSMGTFNVLQVIEEAKLQGCGSLEYKARFLPNEVLTENGWELFRER